MLNRIQKIVDLLEPGEEVTIKLGYVQTKPSKESCTMGYDNGPRNVELNVHDLVNQLDDARASISGLLARYDDIFPQLHTYGMTPSWYVEAAAISCGVKLNEETSREEDAEISEAWAKDRMRCE